MTGYPANHRLQPDDLRQMWPNMKTHGDKIYMLNPHTFQAISAPSPFSVRQLTTSDQTAFDEFYARCSDDDRDEADLGIDHEAAYGVFDNAHIVAAASAFEWRGFVDIGVLTEPDYRKKGLGKVVTAACSAHFLSDERVVIYRHDMNNSGSRGIITGISGFTPYYDVQSVKP